MNNLEHMTSVMQQIDSYIRFNKDYKIYFITIDNFIEDAEIADYLNIKLSTYREILKRHGAIAEGINDECNFQNLSDIEKALEELEPLILMAKLREE